MEKFSLEAQGRELLADARTAAAGRGAKTVYGGHEHVLRQTLIALLEGRELTEHESPGEATLLVLRGRVRLRGEDAAWEGLGGDLLIVPRERHSLEALQDAVVLLTVCKPG